MISQYFIDGMIARISNPLQQSVTVIEIRPFKAAGFAVFASDSSSRRCAKYSRESRPFGPVFAFRKSELVLRSQAIRLGLFLPLALRLRSSAKARFGQERIANACKL